MPGSDKEVSLPKATLSKIIRACLPKELRLSGDTMQMLLDCSTEFVKLLSSEANDMSAREKKNMINPEHVMAALQSLGFESFIPEVQEAWDAWKEENKAKTTSSKGSNVKTAADVAGYSEEQQIKIQQELLAGAIEGTGLMPNMYTHGPDLETDAIKEEKGKESPFPIPESIVPSHAPPTSTTTSSAFIDSSMSFLESFNVQMNKPLSIEKTELSFSGMTSKSDILPIMPLSIPTLPSSFHPHSTSPQIDSHLPMPIPTFLSIPETKSVSKSGPPPSKPLPIDLDQISLAQPIYFEQEGVCHAATWGSILRELAKMPLMRNMVKSHQRKEKVAQDPEAKKRVPSPISLKTCLPLSMQVPLPSSKGKTKPIKKRSGKKNPVTTTHDLLIPSLSVKVLDKSGKEISQEPSSLTSSVGGKHQQKECTKDALDIEIEELRKKRAQRKKEKEALKALKETDCASKGADAKKASERLESAKGDISSQTCELSHPELTKLAFEVGQEGAIKKSSAIHQLEKGQEKITATSLPTPSSAPLPTSIEFPALPTSSHASCDVINAQIPEILDLTESGSELAEKNVRKEKRRHCDEDEDLDESNDGSNKRLKSDN